MTDISAQDNPLTADQAQRWGDMLQHARSRPAMYIGGTATAHLNVMLIPFRLLWQAKVFRKPQWVNINLSPHQCCIFCEAGPLIAPVQRMSNFPGGRILGDSWREERRAYFARYHAEQAARKVPFDDSKYKRSWRYCFSGPTGPRLEEPAYSSLFARRFTWGLRTDQGMWCQAFENGWPAGRPSLVDSPSPTGLFVLADLDPQWFTGLPFTPEDAGHIQMMAHKPQGLDQRWKPEPPWSTGEIVVNWHEEDDLVTERLLTAEGVREWLR